MIRHVLCGAAVAGILAAAPTFALEASGLLQVQTATQATAADAAPFVGDWTLAVEGPNGPASFDLSVKVEKEKVVGEIASEAQAKQAISDVSLTGKDLMLRYTFDYQGTPVDTVVSLKPAADGKTAAQIDFAGGAYVMTGTASKKEPVK